MRIFVARSRLPVPAAEAFAWHARPGAYERLQPPWDPIALLEPHPGIADGSEVRLRARVGPFRTRIVARHRGLDPGRQFVDEMVRGPFPRWIHTHRFLPDGDGCLLEDRVEYDLPTALVAPSIRRVLERTFAFRHARTRHDLGRHRGRPPLRVAVTGATGLIGSALLAFLSAGGHDVRRVVRRGPRGSDLRWDPARGEIDAAALEGIDAVVHLAGESIAAGRWTAKRKEAIRRSRTEGTALLSRALAALRRPPRVLIGGSAIGVYGSRGDEELTEQSPPGQGFLAEVGRAWEEAAAPARAAGIRVVALRTGLVLTALGGALARMLPPFLMGLGGVIAGGRQWMSWIALDDEIGAIHHALTAGLDGPVNATAPAPATNREFTRTLGRVLRRPTILPMPALAARLAFGEMGQALLVEGQRVLPRRLQQGGFRFLFPDLEAALRFELGRATIDGVDLSHD